MHIIKTLLAIGGAATMGLMWTSPTFASAEYAAIVSRASEATLQDITRAGDKLVAVGEHGIIITSKAPKHGWQQAEVPSRALLTAVFFLTAERGWAVGHDGIILATLDGGEHWFVQRDGLTHQLEINRAQRDRAAARLNALQDASASDGSDELALQLEDAELDLEDANWLLDEPVFAPPLMDIWFSNTNDGWAVGAFGTVLTTNNGGNSWEHVSHRLDNPEQFHLYGLTGSANGKLFVAGESGSIYRSLDGGERWQLLVPPYRGSWFGITSKDDRASELVIFGLRGKTFYSNDFGDSWLEIPMPSEMSLSGAAWQNRQLWLVGSVGTVYIIDDERSQPRQQLLAKRLSLTAISHLGNTTVAVGQGGAHLIKPTMVGK